MTRWLLGILLLLVPLSGCDKEEESSAEEEAAEEEPEESPADSKNPSPPASDNAQDNDGNDATTKPTRTQRSARPTPPKTDTQPSPVKARKTQRRKTPSHDALRVDMLDKEAIREATGYGKLLREAHFPGQPPTKTYNATRLATEKGGFGFGLQLWRPGTAQAALKRYNSLFDQSVGGTAIEGAGTQAFATKHHDMRTLTFLNRNAVAAITCEVSLCSEEQLITLAQRVKERIR